ncbi:hypothetical protein ACLK19_18840 [Escherichia coli]
MCVVKERKTKLVDCAIRFPIMITTGERRCHHASAVKPLTMRISAGIVNDIGLLHSLGIQVVWWCYGAHPQIDANLAAHHHKPLYHKNIRVTDAKTLELVKPL